MRAAAPLLRSLVAPAVATLIALAFLVGLGTWQLQRKAWKEDLIARIEARSHGAAGEILPEVSWGEWRAGEDEFRRVRLSGTFLHHHEALVHGLAPGIRDGAPIQGFYVMTPLRLATGGLVMVNRGFIPTELRDPASRPQSRPEGEAAVTGLVRAPEMRGWFTPDDAPKDKRFFAKDPHAIAAAAGLAGVAPFYVDAEATQDPGGWPKGGQTRLSVQNNHLQYAITWFALAAALAGVFGAFAWRALRVARSRNP